MAKRREFDGQWVRAYGTLVFALLCLAVAASTVLLVIAQADRVSDGLVRTTDTGEAP